VDIIRPAVMILRHQVRGRRVDGERSFLEVDDAVREEKAAAENSEGFKAPCPRISVARYPRGALAPFRIASG